MCGGYTRVCVRCGLCGKVEPRPLAESDVCPLCGGRFEPGTVRCPRCGVPLPKAPGASEAGAGERTRARLAGSPGAGRQGKQGEKREWP